MRPGSQPSQKSTASRAAAGVAPRDVLASVNPAVKDVDVTKAFDLSYLQKLQTIGFYQKNNIPTTN